MSIKTLEIPSAVWIEPQPVFRWTTRSRVYKDAGLMVESYHSPSCHVGTALAYELLSLLFASRLLNSPKEAGVHCALHWSQVDGSGVSADLI